MSTCSYSSSNGILDYLDENRFFSFLTTTTFVIIGLFIYIVSLYRYFEREKIPRIAHPFAPYGNIKDVIDNDTALFQLISKFYNKLRKKQLKYGGMYIFFKPGLVIVDPSLANDILLNQDTFSDINRNKDKQTLQLCSSKEVLEDYLTNSSDCIKNDFIECLKKNDSNFEVLLHELVINSMCAIFGLEKNEIPSSLICSAENRATTSSFRYYFNLICNCFKQNISNEWKTLIQNNKLHRKKNDIKKKDIFQSIITTEVDGTLDISINTYVNNFIDNIIYSYYSSLFCLYELSKNTDIQEELIGEIRRFKNSEKNINDLPYLEAVVKETLRVYPPIPLIVKKCQATYESRECGLKIKKGNFVLIPTSAIHHDPRIYVDPENFDPDRFLEDDIEKLSTFIPFGCKITDHEERHKEFQITITVVKVILVCIFSHFKVNLKNENYYLSFSSEKVNMQPEKPIPLEFKPLLLQSEK